MAQTAVKPAKSGRVYATPSTDKLERYGIKAVCDDIQNAIPLAKIAEKLNVSIGSLVEWLDLDAERSSLARAARSRTAVIWDETAAKKIEDATTVLELGKARELAAHYRWRTAKIRPQDYGDKVTVQHQGRVEHALVSEDELNRRLAAFSGVTIDETGEIVED